jgi:tetratricopeptide (TPR) repeat protein
VITIDHTTGTITWGEITIRPDTSEGDFRTQIGVSSPPPAEPEKRGFLKRLLVPLPPSQNAHTYPLPPVSVDGIPATGRLFFKDAIPGSLEIEFEMPEAAEIERLRAYNRFVMAQLKLTHSPGLDRALEYRYPWWVIRCGFLPDGTAVCEILYKASEAKFPLEIPAEIVALIEAQQAIAQAPDSEAARLHFNQLLAQATTVPRGNLEASTGGRNSTMAGGIKRIEFLSKMQDYWETLFQDKNYTDALAAASIMLIVEPEDHSLYANRAEAYRGLKAYDQALADFDEALRRLPPADPAANPLLDYRPHWQADHLRRRGYVHLLKGDPQKAIVDYDASLALIWDAEALNGRGVAYLNQLDFEGALADFEAGMVLAPESPGLIYNRGIVHAHRGDLEQALADVLSGAQKAPENGSILAGVAWVYLLRNEYEDALKYSEQAIRLDPDYGPPYYPRGVVRAARGDTAGARADFRIALERWAEIREPINTTAARVMDEFLAQE